MLQMNIIIIQQTFIGEISLPQTNFVVVKCEPIKQRVAYLDNNYKRV